MQKKIMLVASIFMSLVLAGCSAKYEKYYTFEFPPSDNGKQCIEQCVKTKKKCLNLCTNDEQLCRANAKLQADTGYKDYVEEKHITGGTINYDKPAFFDPMQCSKVSCDCEADYRACYRMCGGIVKVKKRCVAHCPNDEVKNVSY